jgi:hypothetical protein
MARKKTTKELAAQLKRNQYKERAKRLRPFFGDSFKAANGFDLRSPGKWTPQQKAKVTKYFRVMAPRITGEFKVKRYRIPERLNSAIDATLQEQPLKGQTAAVFSVYDTREKLDVKIVKGKAQVKRSGVGQVKLKFDKAAFLADPKKEIDRALSMTDANIFRVLVGGQEQLKTLTRADVENEIMKLVRDYAPANIRRDQGQRPFDDWLNGVVAYPGTEKQTYTAVEKFVHRQEMATAKRERDRLHKLSLDRGGMGYDKTIKQVAAERRARKKR